MKSVSDKAIRKALLDSAKFDAPSADSIRKARVAVMAGSVAVVGLSTAAAGSAMKGGLLLKWIGIGVLGGITTVVTLHFTSSVPKASQPSLAASVQLAPIAPDLLPQASVVKDPPQAPALIASSHGKPAVNQPPIAIAPSSPQSSSPQSSSPQPVPTEPPSLAQEVQMLDHARQALAQHQPSQALIELDQYSEKCSKQRLSHEATFLRIQALLAQGNRQEAATTADRFIQNNPSSPLVSRLRALLGE